MPPASASSARLRLCAESLAVLAADAHTGADQVLRLYPEVGDPRAQAALERVLDDVRGLLSAVDIAANEVSADIFVLAGDGTGGALVSRDGGDKSAARAPVRP